MTAAQRCSHDLELFLASLGEKTRIAYGTDMRAFRRAVGDAVAFAPSQRDIETYLCGLASESGADRACSAIKAFYRWRCTAGRGKTNPADAIFPRNLHAQRAMPASLLREAGIPDAAIARLSWGDVVAPLLSDPRSRNIRVGRNLRPLPASVHDTLVERCELELRRGPLAEVLARSIVSPRRGATQAG